MTKLNKIIGLTFAALAATTAIPGGSVTFDVPPQPLGDVAEGAIAAAAFSLANLSVLGVLVAIAVSLRQWVWAAYTVLVLLGLVYIALFEQNITGVVWSGLDVSSENLIICGYAMLTINFLVAAQTIPKDHKWASLKVPYRVAALGIWVLWIVGLGQPFELQYLLFSLSGCTVAAAHFVPVSTFSRLRGGYDTIIRNLIWVLLTCVLLAGSFLIAGGFDGVDLTVAINRFLIAAITIGFGALFIRNIFILKSDRELAVQEALERAEEKARINEELLIAQENHRAAVEMAHTRNMRLATASHDIRQPLSSLRTSFAALSRDMPSDTKDHLQNSLNYLDELASSYIAEAENDAQPLARQERIPPEGHEQVQSAQIGETLKRMFEGDAKKRGLHLAMDVSQSPLETQPLALMRILCNVMSNAIAHGTPGDIEVQGRSTPAGYVFAISNPGAANLSHKEWEKGEGSSGSGLGLAIVEEQAKRAGLQIATPQSEANVTCVTVTIPAVSTEASA
ncbi:sensor histidine kinase [Gymnodinialimonas hymeniacidonis]|uniref:sensor histidine kinase n=1 Tax=Gymnodinialimonas hymeniacidonis TaxID=3126508 RepID=UPI0034C6AB60